jgi:hypothetical protein
MIDKRTMSGPDRATSVVNDLSERSERLRILLRSTVSEDLFQMIREMQESYHNDLLDADDLTKMFRTQGAASALNGLLRALEFIRGSESDQ